MSSPEEGLVSVYDEQGRQVQIRRSDWLQVIAGNLKVLWNDPERLHAKSLRLAYQDEFEAIEGATIRLLELDPGNDEYFALRASCLVALKRFDQVEAFVKTHMAKHGPSTYGYYHLAMAAGRRGDERSTLDMIERSLDIDPNNIHPMQGWIHLTQKNQGPAAVGAGLSRMVRDRKSWMAAFQLGYRRLADGDNEGAIEMFSKALAIDGWYPTLLTEIAKALMSKQLFRETIELIEPQCTGTRIDPEMGLQLVECWIALEEPDRAENLLHRIALTSAPPFQERIAQAGWKITNLRKIVSTIQLPPGSEVVPVIYTETAPMWWFSLKRPQWLLPDKAAGKKITLIALTVTKPEQAVEADMLGRLSRTIPRFIAERVLFESDGNPEVLTFVNEGRGPCVIPGMTDDVLHDAIGEELGTGVYGAIDFDGALCHLRLNCVDVPSWQVKGELDCTFILGEEGPALRKFSERIMEELTTVADLKPAAGSFYRPPTEALTATYLSCLTQQAALGAVDAGYSPAESVFGRREIENWLQWMAVQMPEAQPPAMFLSALISDKKQGFKYHLEMRQYMLALIDKATPGSALDRLAPLAFKLYDMHEEYGKRMERLRSMGDERYQQWLDRVDA